MLSKYRTEFLQLSERCICSELTILEALYEARGDAHRAEVLIASWTRDRRFFEVGEPGGSSLPGSSQDSSEEDS